MQNLNGKKMENSRIYQDADDILRDMDKRLSKKISETYLVKNEIIADKLHGYRDKPTL